MPKSCLKEPIPEIFEAAQLLNEAANAHLKGDSKLTEQLILKADMPVIRDWTESIWGIGGAFSNLKRQLGDPIILPKEERDPLRMPNKEVEKALLLRDGHFCRFCGIPVIRKEVREALKKKYPDALKWGNRNPDQHAAFQAMWVQYDHLIPHARGGKTTMENMIITCGPCNYGRMNYLLDEIDIFLPDLKPVSMQNWDGLEKILMKNKKIQPS